jgi:hypothetical protein
MASVVDKVQSLQAIDYADYLWGCSQDQCKPMTKAEFLCNRRSPKAEYLSYAGFVNRTERKLARRFWQTRREAAAQRSDIQHCLAKAKLCSV